VDTTLLGQSPTILSGGIGKDVSFELELSRRFNARIAMFDPSPTGRETIQRLLPLPDQLAFFDLGLDAATGLVGFSPPQDPGEGSYRIQDPDAASCRFRCASPKDALSLAGFGSIDLLKLDIEGFECRFIHSLLRARIYPTQIAVEFHDFLPGGSLRSTAVTLMRLLMHGYRPAWKRGTDWLLSRSDVRPD
jgi:FkbM family methyltransferase